MRSSLTFLAYPGLSGHMLRVEVMRMGDKGLVRRAEAVLLAAGTLWTVNVTAGTASPQEAAGAVRDALARTAVRWELPALRGQEGVSLPVILTLSQSPLLWSTGDGSLWRSVGEETGSDGILSDGDASPGTAEADETGQGPSGADPVPLREEQAASPDTAESVPDPVPETPDNGVRARTLAPKDPSGYTVCGRVYISSSRKGTLDVEELREPFAAVLTGDAPQILILHSHGSEGYTPLPGTEVVWSGDHRTTDARYSVVRVGDEMASVFTEAGIGVVHDRTLYDWPNYTGSYDRSLSAIESYLAQYPTIRFILDVHRDSITDGNGVQYKVVSPIEGVGTAAQLTLVIGSDGSGLPHPDWMENLRLAVAIQEQLLSRYPTLMRPILLRKSRYNQHATHGSLLVEVGASGNSPEEARLAARLFAEGMVETLQARTK